MSENDHLLTNLEKKDQEKYPQDTTNEQSKDSTQSSSHSQIDMKNSSMRWALLFLAILTNYGTFFCYDTPQPLQYHMKQIFNIQDAKFNLLYSCMLVPSIILPFFGGMVMDYLGIRMTMIITGFITLLGHLVTSIGAQNYAFEMMLVGRCIFGVGQQTLENSLLLIIAKWFLFKDLAFAWGIARAILRTSSALNSYLCPKLYQSTGDLSTPFLFGLGLSVISLLCIFAVVYIDKKADVEQNKDANIIVANPERIMMSDLKNLPKLFYLILIIGVLTYTSFLGYTNNVNNLLVSRFGFNSENAGSFITIIYLVAGVFSPIVGLAVDRVGRRAFFIFAAIVMNFLSHLFFTLLQDTTTGSPNYDVIIGFIGFGIFYALFSTTYWTSLAIIIPKALGTGSGMITCISATSQSIFPGILGLIHDNSLDFHNGYFYTQIAHCGIMLLVIIVVILTYFEDIKTGGKLRNEKPEAKKD